MFKNVFLSYCFLLFVSTASAQTWEVGGFVGASGYMGDISPNRPLDFNHLGFGVNVQRNFNGHMGLNFGFRHGKVEAWDADSKNENQRMRNLNFFSDVNEVALTMEYNFFNFVPGVSKKKYTPFLFAGVGALFFNPKTEYKGEVVTLAGQFTEGQRESYNRYALTVPYGAGVKYNFSKSWSIKGELGYRTAFTDYLDDVSKNYYDPTQIRENGNINPDLADRSYEISPNGATHLFLPPNAPSGLQRGDYRKRDTYMFTGISITYTFGNCKCPPAF